MGRVAVLRLGLGGGLRLDQAVRHPDHAGLAVQFEEQLDLAILAGLADRLQPHLQRLAGVDLDRDLFARRHAVEEGAGRQGAHRAVGSVATHVVEEDLGIHQVAVQVFIIDPEAQKIVRHLRPHRFQIDLGKMLAGAVG